MSITQRSIEVLQGNPSVRRVMAEALERLGATVVSRSGDESDPEKLCDLLVVDVDSGVLDVEKRAALYAADERSVVFCGLRGSRDEFEGATWIDRPFTPTTFTDQCAEALGLNPAELGTPEPATPKKKKQRAPSPDDPITRELNYEEATELERRLGLEEGSLAAVSEGTVSDEDSFEVLELDDSIIMEVDDLQFVMGGKVIGEVGTRRVSGIELASEREADIQVLRSRNPAFSQTMPETPIALGSDIDDTHDRNAPRVGDKTEASRPGERSGSIGTDEAPTSPPSGAGSDLGAQITGVARMLAESWQRIALTTRTDDRADRIEKILIAAVSKGLRGAAEVVQRIPQATGFSGNLSTLTFVDTVRTIRDRKLRGRLEVAVGEDDAFVLYMDGMHLAEIDTLSGNVDGMLLDILHQGGAIDDEVFAELQQAWSAGHFVGPLDIELGRKQIVADATLQSARVVRAREIFRKLCSTRGGQFAFLEIRPGDGQPWPIDSLRISVDQLLLELLRESSIDTGDSQATARTRLLLDPNRAAALDQERLTDEERNVMMFFKEGETLESARERLQKHAGPEDVDRIVDRLKKVELLKRSDPTIPIPREVEQKQLQNEAQQEKQPRNETVISDLSNKMSREELARKFKDDKTTSMKSSYDLLPDSLDTDEVDAMVQSAIDAFGRGEADESGD